MSSGGVIGVLFVIGLVVALALEWLNRRSRASTEQDLQPQPVRRSRDGH
jgi:hypothetical protein